MLYLIILWWPQGAKPKYISFFLTKYNYIMENTTF